MRIWCGIDVGRRRSDYALMDREGRVVDGACITNDLDGVATVIAAIRAHSKQARASVPIAVDEVNALVPSALASKGYQLIAVHPVAEARHRRTLVASGLKTDRVDAVVLANIARTEPRLHQHYPRFSAEAFGVRLLARSQQAAGHDVRRAHSKVDALLARFYPAALSTFSNLTAAEARLVLELAPSPGHARSLRERQLAAALRQLWPEFRCRPRAAMILENLRAPHLRLPPAIEEVMSRELVSLLQLLNGSVAHHELATAATLDQFRQHPDYAIYSSFPGLRGIIGARILGELGDDRSRFANDWSIGAMAGVIPVTRSSGGSLSVRRRMNYNRRLGNAVNLWTLPLLNGSPEARRYYDTRRAAGDRYPTAARKLGRRYLRILRCCLLEGRRYEERGPVNADRPSAAVGSDAVSLTHDPDLDARPPRVEDELLQDIEPEVICRSQAIEIEIQA